MLKLDSRQDPSRNKETNLLLLDDNPADQEIIKVFFSRIRHKTYNIHTVENVKSAIEVLTNHTIDISIVDYQLANETAFDFLKAVPEEHSTPVIVMTGQTDEALDYELMKAGVDDYWSKNTLNEHILERAVKNALQRHQLINQYRAESERKSRHLANIAHELKNPLSVAYGFLALIKKQCEKQNIQEKIPAYIETINTNLQQMNRLVHEILDFSKITLDSLHLNITDFNFYGLVDEVVENFSSIAHKDDIKIETSHPPDEIYSFKGDRDRIWQILSNLVSNGLKYTEAGKVSINIINLEDEVCIEVSDTGIGIHQENLSKLFNPFQVFHQTLNKKVDQTGLGLSITKSLVELHKGTIEVESTIGRGSKFAVILPSNLEG